MKKSALLITLITITANVFADRVIVDSTTITSLAVNGGEDATVTGVSCVKYSGSNNNGCEKGWLAIDNNNSELISAALAAKMANSDVKIYYSDQQPSLKCPAIINTTCRLDTIVIK